LRFGQVVDDAAERCLPNVVCEHLYDVARAFSAFYAECPVIKTDDETRASRLALSALTARQLERGMALLGIRLVERM
jgi:arginyl-tRNA synthetase